MSLSRAGHLAASALLVVSSAVGAEGGDLGIELVGEAVVPRELAGSSVPVGGLSGLSYDRVADRYFALSDDPSRFGPARFYEIRIDLKGGDLVPGGVEVLRAVALKTAEGADFGLRTIDPESLARTSEGSWIVASEGHADRGVRPALFEFSETGAWLREIAVPRRLRPKRRTGVRHNMALESVTISPDGRWLFTATENALRQDGSAATEKAGSSSRLLRYDLPSRRLASSYLYRTEPIADPPEGGAFAVNGLVDLVALDGERLLALERSFTAGHGNTVRIFRVELAGASDVSRVRRLGSRTDIVPVAKHLLLDVAELGVEPDNLEGMAFGPTLDDGRRTLLLVADDNFDPGRQRSQLVALAIGPGLLSDSP